MNSWMDGWNKKDEKEADPESRDYGLKMEIDHTVFQKFMYWVMKADRDEVSAIGSVIHDKDKNILRVIDVWMLPQKNGGATTDIDAVELSKLQYEHYKLKRPGELRWWAHSHHYMGVFWSGTDIATLKNLGAGGWYCATVFNNKREVKSAFVQNDPVRLLIEDLKTTLSPHVSSNKEWDEEYDKNVKKYTYSGDYAGNGQQSFSWASLSEEEREQLRGWLREQQQKSDKTGAQGIEEISKKIQGFQHQSLDSKKPNLAPVQKKQAVKIGEREFDQLVPGGRWYEKKKGYAGATTWQVLTPDEEKTLQEVLGLSNDDDEKKSPQSIQQSQGASKLTQQTHQESQIQAKKESEAGKETSSSFLDSPSDNFYDGLPDGLYSLDNSNPFDSLDIQIKQKYFAESSKEERLNLLETIRMYDPELAREIQDEEACMVLEDLDKKENENLSGDNPNDWDKIQEAILKENTGQKSVQDSDKKEDTQERARYFDNIEYD